MSAQKTMRLYYIPTRKCVLEGPLYRFGKGGLKLIKSWVSFSRSSVSTNRLLRGKLFLSPLFGICRAYGLKDQQGKQLPWRPFHIIFPNPLLFPLWGKFLLPLKSQGLTLEVLEVGSTSVERELTLDEKEILGRVGEESYQRIHFLLKKLVFVEDRAAGSSRLYKNSKDNTLWQYLEIPDLDGQGVLVRFTQVTLPQWTYGYLEQKFLMKGEKQIEVERSFWDALEEGPRNIPCSEEGCGNIRVQYSALCKVHHFKAIFGGIPTWTGSQDR